MLYKPFIEGSSKVVQQAQGLIAKWNNSQLVDGRWLVTIIKSGAISYRGLAAMMVQAFQCSTSSNTLS